MTKRGMIKLDDIDLFKVIMCPECGHDEEFVTKNGQLLAGMPHNGKCPMCGLFFHVGRSDAGMRGGIRMVWITVYASRKSYGFTLDEWEWKIFFFSDNKKLPQWQTYSDLISSRRTDSKPIEEVNKLVFQRWEGQKVAELLRSNSKRK